MESGIWHPQKQGSNAKRVISMLVAMETEYSLRRGAIMVIAKKLAWHMQSEKHMSVGHNEFSRIFFMQKKSLCTP